MTNQPNNESKTLLDILTELVVTVNYAINDTVDDTDMRDRAYKKAETAITALMEQVIGEDERAGGGDEYAIEMMNDLVVEPRNGLRAEQRQRLQQLMGDSK